MASQIILKMLIGNINALAFGTKAKVKEVPSNIHSSQVKVQIKLGFRGCFSVNHDSQMSLLYPSFLNSCLIHSILPWNY